MVFKIRMVPEIHPLKKAIAIPSYGKLKGITKQKRQQNDNIGIKLLFGRYHKDVRHF